MIRISRIVNLLWLVKESVILRKQGKIKRSLRSRQTSNKFKRLEVELSKLTLQDLSLRSVGQLY